MKMENRYVLIIGMILMTIISLMGLVLAIYTGFPLIAVVLSFGSVVFNYYVKVSFFKKGPL